MKRIKYLSMLLALTAMSLIACGNNQTPVDENEEETDGPVVMAFGKRAKNAKAIKA